MSRVYCRFGVVGVAPGVGVGVLDLNAFQWLAVGLVVSVTYAIVRSMGG